MNNLSKKINFLAIELKLDAFKDLDKEQDIDENTKEIILKLLQQQCDIQLTKKNNRRIKLAGFPYIKTIDTFTLDKQIYPNLDLEIISTLATCKFISSHQDVVAIGPPGFGKTHLALSLGLEAIRKEYRVIYKTASNIVTEMEEAETDKKLMQYKSRLAKCDLLIIDDMGYTNYSARSIKYLFDIVSIRSELKSTFVISNLVFSKWTKGIKNEEIMAAIIDRLTFNSIILNMNNRNLKMGWRYSHSFSKTNK
jgi:DNA replication protein DnaC